MIEQKRQRAILVVGSVFTISTTVGQVASIPQLWIQALILASNFCAWIYFTWIFRRYQPPLPSTRQVEQLAGAFDADALRFRYARTEIELEHIWKIDNEIYSSFNIPLKTLFAWFSKFHSGALMMFRGPRFLGYVGIYPITASSFLRLRTGQLAEEEISADDIASDTESAVCATWYFSGYALYEPSLFSSLVAEALRAWASRLQDSDDMVVEAVSFAMPGSDELFLRTLGFMELSTERRAEQLPIVYRTFSKEDILLMAESIERQNQQPVVGKRIRSN